MSKPNMQPDWKSSKFCVCTWFHLHSHPSPKLKMSSWKQNSICRKIIQPDHGSGGQTMTLNCCENVFKKIMLKASLSQWKCQPPCQQDAAEKKFMPLDINILLQYVGIMKCVFTGDCNECNSKKQIKKTHRVRQISEIQCPWQCETRLINLCKVEYITKLMAILLW